MRWSSFTPKIQIEELPWAMDCQFCYWVIGSILMRKFASQIVQNQNFFGNFVLVKNDRANLVNDCHFCSTRPFLSWQWGGATWIQVARDCNKSAALPPINQVSKLHCNVFGKPPILMKKFQSASHTLAPEEHYISYTNELVVYWSTKTRTYF